MNRLLFWLCFSCQSLASLSSKAEDVPLAVCVRVDVQMVRLANEEGLRLVPLLGNPTTRQEAYTRLQEMLARQEITLLAWPVVWVKTGGRARSGSGEEFRYPVEFTPPQMQDKFGGSPQHIRPTWGQAVPTAFESRDMGVSLDVDAAHGIAQETVTLTVATALSQLVKFHRFRKQSSPLGIQGVLEQPEFLRRTAQTTLTLRNGIPTLLSVSTTPAPDAHLELFIIRATVFPRADIPTDAKQP